MSLGFVIVCFSLWSTSYLLLVLLFKMRLLFHEFSVSCSILVLLLVSSILLVSLLFPVLFWRVCSPSCLVMSYICSILSSLVINGVLPPCIFMSVCSSLSLVISLRAPLLLLCLSVLKSSQCSFEFGLLLSLAFFGLVCLIDELPDLTPAWHSTLEFASCNKYLCTAIILKSGNWNLYLSLKRILFRHKPDKNKYFLVRFGCLSTHKQCFRSRQFKTLFHVVSIMSMRKIQWQVAVSSSDALHRPSQKWVTLHSVSP